MRRTGRGERGFRTGTEKPHHSPLFVFQSLSSVTFTPRQIEHDTLFASIRNSCSLSSMPPARCYPRADAMPRHLPLRRTLCRRHRTTSHRDERTRRMLYNQPACRHICRMQVENVLNVCRRLFFDNSVSLSLSEIFRAGAPLPPCKFHSVCLFFLLPDVAQNIPTTITR